MFGAEGGSLDLKKIKKSNYRELQGRGRGNKGDPNFLLGLVSCTAWLGHMNP